MTTQPWSLRVRKVSRQRAISDSCVSAIASLAAVSLLLASVGCATRGLQERPTIQRVTPSPGKAAVVGVLAQYPSTWSGRPLFVYAARYAGDPAGDGVFVLEPSLDPWAEIGRGGEISLVDIPPLAYVIVIGPNPEEAIAVRDGARVRILQLGPDSVIDLGEVTLAY